MSGLNLSTVGFTSSISITDNLVSRFFNDTSSCNNPKLTFTIGNIVNGISVFQCLCNTANDYLGSCWCCVDRNETEWTFRDAHDEDLVGGDSVSERKVECEKLSNCRLEEKASPWNQDFNEGFRMDLAFSPSGIGSVFIVRCYSNVPVVGCGGGRLRRNLIRPSRGPPHELSFHIRDSSFI
jgi:hypothetical protein